MSRLGRLLRRRLGRHGYRVLDGRAVPGKASIDHLVIGPPGVVAVSTKHHPKGKVKVYERSLYVDGATKNYVWMSEREARHAATALTEVCGFTVPTQSAVVFVDVESWSSSASMRVCSASRSSCGSCAS